MVVIVVGVKISHVDGSLFFELADEVDVVPEV